MTVSDASQPSLKQKQKQERISKPFKDNGVPKSLQWIERNQISLTLTPITIILLLTYLQPPIFELSTKDTLLPSLRISDKSFASKFVYLSYLDPAETSENKYLKGPDDVFIVIFWVLGLILARALLMNHIYTPLAKCWGIKKHRDAVRFAEQGWVFTYPLIFWSLGVYILQSSPTRNLKHENYIIGYPHIHLSPLMKWYYLIQTSFWFSQIITINIEARRKDYVQMFTHHIITAVLIVLSLVTNWTLVGNVVLVLMDLVDILLPFAKMLRYLGLQTLCDCAFGLFVISWIVTRQILFSVVIWTIFQAHIHIPYRWDPPHGQFFNLYSHVTFLSLLSSLQVINCIWLYQIIRIIIRVLKNDNASDPRSDSEDSDEEEDEKED